MPEGGLVVDKEGGGVLSGVLGGWINTEKYGSVIVIVVLMLIVASVAYCKHGLDGFASPDGVVARRSQRQVRSDTEVDRTWNLKELERSVALLNKKSGAYE
jgi:hypothetical protein